MEGRPQSSHTELGKGMMQTSTTYNNKVMLQQSEDKDSLHAEVRD